MTRHVKTMQDDRARLRQYEKVAAAFKGFRPAMEVRIDLGALGQDIAEVQGRIKQAFYADLFLMMAESDRREITAREIDERHEEKMLMITNGILDTAAQGRALDLGQISVYLKTRIASAPSGVVKPVSPPAQNNSPPPVDNQK